MERGFNTKSKGLVPIDGYAELNPAYGPWSSTDECTNFWTQTIMLTSVPEAANCAVKKADGTIEKYVFEKGAWRKEGAGGGGSVETVNGTHPDASGDIKLDIVSKADCTMDSEKIIVGLLNKDDDTLFNLDIGAVSTTGAGVMTPAMLTKLNNVPTSIAVPDSSFQESQLYDEYKNFGEVITFENLD